MNHMTGSDSGSGVAGSSFTHYDYPGIYQTQVCIRILGLKYLHNAEHLPQDFHHCGLTPDDDIEDYTSQAQVQTCELVNLAESVSYLDNGFSYWQLNTSLATDTDYVQETLAGYVNDLLSLGVDGLRLDAAKRTYY
jgi:glycosidase